MIVLIGASGFIGRHLLDETRLPGERIRCLARNPSALATARANVEVIAATMGDEAQLDRALEPGAIVVNLAFDRSALPSENVAAALVLARACRRARVARLLHVSTAAVVGANPSPLIDESSRCEPASAYESTKLQIEDALRAEAREGDLVIVRPTAVFGAGGQNLVKLARETASGAAAPRYLRALFQGRRPMNLVSVETVCAAIAHLANQSGNCAHDVFIVSDDEAPTNNYRDVERVFMEAFGRAGYGLPLVRLPPALENSVRRLAGKSASPVHRRFSAGKLLSTGFVKPLGFDEALGRYAAYLAQQCRARGEVVG